jgi:hypothetical protein
VSISCFTSVQVVSEGSKIARKAKVTELTRGSWLG